MQYSLKPLSSSWDAPTPTSSMAVLDKLAGYLVDPFAQALTTVAKIFTPVEAHDANQTTFKAGSADTSTLRSDFPWEGLWDMGETGATPTAVVRIAGAFWVLSEVKSIFALERQDCTVLTVLVDMPKYDHALYRKLIQIQLEADTLAETTDLVLEYRYLPFQHLSAEMLSEKHVGQPLKNW